MPRTSTIPPGLKYLLARLNLTVASLSKRTGLLKTRIIEIYQEGKATLYELRCLLSVLGSALVNYLTTALGEEIARYVTHGVQTGLFNQGGSFNEQNVVVNIYVNPVFNVTHVTEPQTKALSQGPQRWDAQPVQPGGIVRQIEQPMQPGGQVQQIGQAAQEMGRAA